MKPRLTVLTLGVADLDRSLAFYRDGLGWPTPGIIGITSLAFTRFPIHARMRGAPCA